MADFTEALRNLLASQDFVSTRAQLLEGGLSKETIRWNAGRRWRVLLPNTYLIGRDAVTWRHRHVAALLYAGDDSVITGSAATGFYGLNSAFRGDAVDVVTPPTRRRRNRGFVAVRPSLLIDHAAVRKGPFRYASVGRACVDAAASMRSLSAREALFIEASQKGLISLDDLADWVFRLRTRDAIGLHQALRAAASGAWSLPECRLLDLLSTSRVLPAAWPNPALDESTGLPLLTPDVWFDDVALAVMVHSRRHHSEGDQWDSTVDRDSGLTTAGVTVLGVTPAQIDKNPADVLAKVEAAYVVAGLRPRPGVTAYEREGWLRLTSPQASGTG